MIVFITGFMGVGKTTIGKQLAELMQLPFIDLDQAIEESEGKTISWLFNQKGETYFRRAEREVLEKITAKPIKAVVALGGGTMCNLTNHKLILENGVAVFLEREWREIEVQLKTLSDRPLAAAKTTEELHQLYIQRLPYYRKSQLQIVVKTGFDVEKLHFLLKLLTNR